MARYKQCGIVGLAAVLLALSGCTATNNAESGPVVEPELAIVNATDMKTFSLPMDAYLPTPDQKRSLETARNVLFAKCMREFGFTIVVPATAPPLPFGVNEQRYGLQDPDRAGLVGYHMPEVADRPKPSGDGLPPAADVVANGTGSSQYRGMKVPDGGCLGEAKRQLAGGAEGAVNSALVSRLTLESYSLSAKDSRVLAAFREWSAAMKLLGFAYASPRDANNDPAFQTPEPAAREIAVAKADVDCKARVGLVKVWAAVETAYQLRAVERYSVELAGVRDALAKQVANASRIVAAH